MRYHTGRSAVESHIPIPGYWYINTSGKLIRVRLIGYTGVNAYTAVIEFIDGATQTIAIGDWQCLDIVTPCQEPDTLLRESDRQR